MGCGGSKGTSATDPADVPLATAIKSEARTNMAPTRKFLVGGNWKMNGTKTMLKELLSAWNAADVNKDVEVVIGVPAPYLDFVRAEMREDFATSSQNIYPAQKGAFTGEISADMIKDCGATWAIVGHSERRTLFGDTNETVGEKTKFALTNGLKAMPCVGETLEEREAGKTMDVVKAQLQAIKDANDSGWDNVVIAYEPVWAIGTGKVATPETAQQVHADIRKWLATEISQEVADNMRILYGGSVKTTNCVELAKCPDIDGFLVGGASLKPDFTDIINATR